MKGWIALPQDGGQSALRNDESTECSFEALKPHRRQEGPIRRRPCVGGKTGASFRTAEELRVFTDDDRAGSGLV